MSDNIPDHLPDNLPGDPMHWADAWIKEAYDGGVRKNPNSMTLVTAAGGMPAARIVLCKEFVPDPGYLVFYTNYESRKAREIEENPNVAVVFHWDAQGRQIRIEGIAVKSPEAESDAYFASRDWGSQLGAWGSDQSRELESREALIEQIQERAAKLGIELGADTSTLADGQSAPSIQRPPHWGGYRIWANHVELWKEGASRVHDRAVWKRDIVRASDTDFSVSPWQGGRVQP